jgi:predicted MPP superfamily phosphohydrolase
MSIRIRNEIVQLFNGQEQLSLLHISDIHVWFSRRILDDLKEIIFKTNPELIILTGDYYDTPKGAHLFKEFLSEVANSFRIFFISGNHDLLWGRKVFDLLSRIPNCFFVGEDLCSFVSKKGNKYNIGSWKHRSLFEEKSHEKNIVLIHNPEKLNIKELKYIDLILAGHLHGGQFIFFTFNNSHYPGSFFYRHCADRKQFENTTLIVSRGIGDSFPLRFNCPREVVKITIK